MKFFVPKTWFSSHLLSAGFPYCLQVYYRKYHIFRYVHFQPVHFPFKFLRALRRLQICPKWRTFSNEGYAVEYVNSTVNFMTLVLCFENFNIFLMVYIIFFVSGEKNINLRHFKTFCFHQFFTSFLNSLRNWQCVQVLYKGLNSNGIPTKYS